MRISRIAAVVGILAGALFCRAADESNPANVQLEAGAAKPRAVESLTAQRIRSDYAQAWASLAEAFNSGNADRIDARFSGPAHDNLSKALRERQQAGLRSHLGSQSHKLEAVFYAPEGDVMELHDTATYDLQLLDGANVIHDEHVTLNYIVLMTPVADGWVVRQLQAVPAF